MSRRFFITGTDTGVGKTCVATALLRRFAADGLTTVGFKPLASGCLAVGDGLRNDDALAIQAAMTEPAPYEAVNPVALAPAIAPHLAAADMGVSLTATGLAAAAERLPPADRLVIEGAGGWRVPLNTTETMADLARALQASVILVVGVRLGCLNHAALSAEAIRRDRVPFIGWVANEPEAHGQRVEEQIGALEQRLDEPLLARIPYAARVDAERLAGGFRGPGARVALR